MCMKQLYLFFILVALASCGGSDSSSVAVDAPVPIGDNPPDVNTYPGVSWETYAPADVNMAESGIKDALDYAFKSTRNTQGVVIIRHGIIVGERYANEESQDSLATSWSSGKSFASALIGIAMDQGLIESIDVPAEEYLPSWVNTDKANISVRAVLEMRTGLKKSTDGDFNIYEGGINGDQLAYALDRIPETVPRTDNWVYQNTDSMLLAGILEEASGQSILDYADRHLFSKIGMNADWWTDKLGHALTYCCIDTTSRDFARFGLLYARNGRWGEDQIVSEAWVKESTSAPPGTDNQNYALQWWVNPSGGYFYSAGLNENNIHIFPDLDLVVVRNSLYTKMGSSSIRGGDNYHLTLEPLDWSNDEFLSYITDAINN